VIERDGGRETTPGQEQPGSAVTATPADALTAFGAVVGTPEYIAPEQARGDTVGPRSDLFSLGCVLYRLCTGAVPFRGADALATLRAVERDDPRPPRALNAAVPRPLSDLVLRLLAKRPEDRPASAQEVMAALEKITPDPGSPLRRLLAKAVAVAILLSASGFAGVWLVSLVWRPQPADAPDGSPVAAVVPFQPCHFAPQVAYAVGLRPYCVAVGDFNGDGKPDLVVTMFLDDVAVLLNNGDGTFRRGVSLAADAKPFGVAISDFNSDGILDLAVTREKADCVSIYRGQGDGTFQAPRDFASGSQPQGVAVGDFDADGKLDLAVANQNPGGQSVSVLRGNGDGTFRSAVQYPSPMGAIAVAVADFNGDGKADLVTSNGQGDTVRVFLGNGDGTFRSGVPYSVGNGPGVVVVADFNGDGAPDLAVENVGFHNVSVLLGKGDGTFRPAVSYPAGLSPGGLAVADFNGDGKPDLAVANHFSYNVSVLLGNGDGTFRPPLHYAAGWTPAGVAVADFNGDNKPDVAVANYFGGNVSVLLNRPPTPHFRLGAAFDFHYGAPGTVTVTAMDSHGNPDTHYVGTLHATSSDDRAEFSDNDHTHRPEDNGVWSFGITMRKGGAHTLTVVDQDGSRLGTLTTVVKPLTGRQFHVGAPPECKAGVAFRVTILAQDEFETQSPDYVGTVRVTSSDPQAVLPPDYKVGYDDNGACRLPLTLRTPGEQTITVTDTAKGAIVGRATVNVAP
jgi:hypothetical protein